MTGVCGLCAEVRVSISADPGFFREEVVAEIRIQALSLGHGQARLQVIVILNSARSVVAEQAGMGSAIGAFLHNVVAPESSSDRFVFHPANSPMFRCRKRRAVSSKKAKHEAW